MFKNIQQNDHKDTTKSCETDSPQDLDKTFAVRGGGFITDAHHHILSVHGAFDRITGYTAAEVIGKNPSFLKSDHQDVAFYQHMWATILRDGYWEGEIHNRRKNGEIYLEWGQISALANKDGVITHYVIHFSDISNDKN